MRYSLDAAWLCLSTLELVTTDFLVVGTFFVFSPVFVKARARPTANFRRWPADPVRAVGHFDWQWLSASSALAGPGQPTG